MIKRYRILGLVIICGLSIAGAAVSAAAPISRSHSKLLIENHPASMVLNPAQPMAIQNAETWAVAFTITRDIWLGSEGSYRS